MVVELYFANGKSPTQAAVAFNYWAAANLLPTIVTKKNVIDLMKRFAKADFCGKNVRPHRPNKTTDENNLLDVTSCLFQQRGASIRQCAEQLDLSYGTVHTIARRVLKLYPYRLTLVQKLSDFDKIVRVEACRRLLDIINIDRLIVYSDECNFYTDGHVNTWNCRIWDYVRPPDFFAEVSQGAKSVTVWAGMTQHHLFGPYFFPSTVTGDSYRAILSEFFIQDLTQAVGDVANVWFQQDGAPAHSAIDTRAFISSVFQTRVISRLFLHEWPPRSPDLTPCDFHLWGTVKDIVYMNGTTFNSVEELQDAVSQAFGVIRQDKMEGVRNAVQSVARRMADCVALGGCQLTHC